MRKLLVVGILLLSTLVSHSQLHAQDITAQKKVVAFLFGTVHPLNADKTPMRDKDGQPVSVEMPLGTGFFVGYPDPGGSNLTFGYLVTAKHVLRDFDSSFLPKIRVRLNLVNPNGDTACGFIDDLPVTDGHGKLIWLNDKNDPSNETVAFPLLPDVEKYDIKAIPINMFVTDSELKSDSVAEGDNLYFIGLMAQYYGEKRNYPVVRRGTLALMTDEKISTPTGPEQVFIAELQSWPGNSGSPVFLNLGGFRGNAIIAGQNLKFLGILLGVYNNILSGRVLGEDESFTTGNALPIGVSLIVPATRLRALLDSPEAQQLRDTELKKRQAATVN